MLALLRPAPFSASRVPASEITVTAGRSISFRKMNKCKICLEVKPDAEFKHVKMVLNGVEVLDRDARFKNCCEGPCYLKEKQNMMQKQKEGYRLRQVEIARLREVELARAASGGAATSSSSSEGSSSSGGISSEGSSGGSNGNNSGSNSISTNSTPCSITEGITYGSSSTSSIGRSFTIAHETVVKQCARNGARSLSNSHSLFSKAFTNVPKQVDYLITVWSDEANMW